MYIGFLVYCNSKNSLFLIITNIHYRFSVSEDVDISPDEHYDRREDKYEHRFIDDHTTPTGQFSQSSEQGGENSDTNDMMAFCRYNPRYTRGLYRGSLHLFRPNVQQNVNCRRILQ